MSVPEPKTGAAQPCLCPHLDQFVDHVQTSGWSQVCADLDHMNGCCHWLKAVVSAAAADQKADWVVRLCDEHSSQENSGLFGMLMTDDRWPALMDLCPVGSALHGGLKAMLLMASIKFHLEDFTLHILQRGSVTDSQLMEAIKFSIQLKHSLAFLLLIKECPKSRRVFKQKFVHQHWTLCLLSEDEGKVFWIFRTLYKGGEKDLAMFVAGSSPQEKVSLSLLFKVRLLDAATRLAKDGLCEKSLIQIFCWSEMGCFDLKQKMYRQALQKLYEYDTENYTVFVQALYLSEGRSSSDRSFLFHQAIRLGKQNLFRVFLHHELSQNDLDFLISWLVLGNADHESFLLRYHRISSWLESWAANSNSYLADDSTKPFYCTFFRKVIAKCVQLDHIQNFVDLCKMRSTRIEKEIHLTKREDLTFAYTAAIEKRPHFVSTLCTEMIAKQGRPLAGLLLVLDIALEKKAWNVLPALPLSCPGLLSATSWRLFCLLERCVHTMLSDQTTWADLAPTLDQWVRGKAINLYKRKTFFTKHGPFSVSSLSQWCVDNGYTYLALFLALVMEDWEMVNKVVTPLSSLDLHPFTLWEAVNLADNKTSLSVVTMLKICPLNADIVDFYQPFQDRSAFFDWCNPKFHCLTRTCEQHGLHDWALVLQCTNLNYLQGHQTLCQNPAVWSWIMKKTVAVPHGNLQINWQIVKEFMGRCTDAACAKPVLVKAVEYGHDNIVEVLINYVDPTTCEGKNSETLLYSAVLAECVMHKKLKIIQVCVAAGMSTFQRQQSFAMKTCLLLKVIILGHSDLVKLLLDSGCFSHKYLYDFASNRQLQRSLLDSGHISRLRIYFLFVRRRPFPVAHEEMKKQWKADYQKICQAAASPLRLEHIARLVASHIIGCQPGRTHRINSLTCPRPLKDMLNFKDVVGTEEEEMDTE